MKFLKKFLLRADKALTTKRVLIVMLLLIFTSPLYAYLDPGTGSMLLAVLIGIVSTLLFTLRSMWIKIVTFFASFVHKKNSTDKLASVDAETAHLTADDFNSVVCYSEGKQYWSTFRPLIEAMHKHKMPGTYLSSDEDDEGLSFVSPYIKTKYIGKGSKAYTYLNLLQAHVCVLTTPNLDVLQIRRSKGVKHYTHLVHAPTDVHLYKLFAFDFYDSIMVSGPHQEKSLRHLEELRKTNPKQIFNVGCPYMDVLLEKKQSYDTSHSQSSKEETVVLLAPTWGESGLLNSYGKELIEKLLDCDAKIIVRPHPQSLMVEKEFIEYLQQSFADNPRVVWDTQADNFESLNTADILLSDRSGVIFDFSFIFKKPVITHNAKVVLEGMEGNDIPWNAWELDIFDRIGQTLKDGDFDNIEEIVTQTLANISQYQANIQKLQEESLYNLGSSGEATVDVLQSILSQSD